MTTNWCSVPIDLSIVPGSLSSDSLNWDINDGLATETFNKFTTSTTNCADKHLVTQLSRVMVKPFLVSSISIKPLLGKYSTRLLLLGLIH